MDKAMISNANILNFTIEQLCVENQLIKNESVLNEANLQKDKLGDCIKLYIKGMVKLGFLTHNKIPFFLNILDKNQIVISDLIDEFQKEQIVYPDTIDSNLDENEKRVDYLLDEMLKTLKLVTANIEVLNRDLLNLKNINPTIERPQNCVWLALAYDICVDVKQQLLKKNNLESPSDLNLLKQYITDQDDELSLLAVPKILTYLSHPYIERIVAGSLLLSDSRGISSSFIIKE